MSPSKLSPRPVRLSRTILGDLILPEDGNARGQAFGGSVMKLIDKAAYVCACRHAGTANCVTVSMEEVNFKVPIAVGELVILEAHVNFVGRTSIEIGVDVYAEDLSTGRRRQANSCFVHFVALDAKGRPTPIAGLICETDEERVRYEEAKERRGRRLKLKT